MRDLERGIAHFTCLLTEDRAQEALFSGELGLALRGDLADEHIAGVHFSTDTDDAIRVEIGDHVFGDVRDLAGDLLRAELGIACIDLVFRDMDRGEQVFCDHTLGDDDSVLVVEAFPWHVSDHEVLAERKLCAIAGWTISQNVADFNAVALLHDGLVVHATALVGALELRHEVFVVFAVFALDDDGLAIDVVDNARILRNEDLA